MPAAWLPSGEAICARSTHSGALAGMRFWKNASPASPCQIASFAPGNTPLGQRSSVVGRSRSARMIPSPTARK
jgi:hypothetical protein